MPGTLFDKIISGQIKSWKVWEDQKHLAFLTPFPNTPGFTVVIPKRNASDYVFALDDEGYIALLLAVKTVAGLLEKALDVPRVAMVFEGTGVAHAHAKLIPLHGPLASQTDVWSSHREFHEEYRGYLTTVEGPAMDEPRLHELAGRIRQAAGA